MIRKILFILFISFFLNFHASILFANTDDLIKGGTKIIQGVIGEVEIAIKGKKLKQYFQNNSLNLSFDGTIKVYQFKEKKYEAYTDNKLIETGKWKVQGLLKNQIKLGTG